MARSRSSSFSDDDLHVVSSQAAESQVTNASYNASPGKMPLRTINNPNTEAIEISDSPMPSKMGSTADPVFGHPTQMGHLFQKKKPVNMFNQNRSRPEHHRDLHRIPGPSLPKYEDRKPAPMQMYSSLPELQPNSYTAYPISSYSQSSAAHDDVHIYTDPTKASADLKALLEGGMEDEDEEKEKTEGLEDGVMKGIKVKLLPHQVEGVEWMRGRELGPVKRGKVPRGGILADDMGLGKTLQAISLILSNSKPRHDEKGWKKHYDNVEKTTLVVAPLALIRQWEAEIQDKVAKDHRLTVCVHHGPSRTKRFQDLAKYDVVITTYQILVSEYGHSNDTLKAGCFGLHWYRVVLDEAHSIKNRNAKATKACCALQSEFRWCLTGTPMQNNLDELQSLVNFLRITPYNNLADWRAHIDAPMKNGKGHIAIRRLHSVLRCFMKRRTKDILKEEGALNPGGKKALDAAAKDGGAAPAPAFKVTERKVVSVSAVFSPAERQFYDRLAERADKSLAKMMKGKVNYANALVLLLRLRQACNHPKLVGANLEKDKEALSTDVVQPKSTDDDVDALTSALGGMGIETKQCEICVMDLSKDEVADGKTVCSECDANRHNFDVESPLRKKSKKKPKVTKVVKEEVKVEVKKRQPRNRRVIMEREDEEDDASWLVPEDNRGSLHLGKAGGEEDEDAEGGGESINPEDSVHHSEDEDGSQLDSFVINDESAQSAADSSDDDDSFPSLSNLRLQGAAKKVKKSAPPQDDSSSASDSDSDDDTGVSESEFDSDDGSLMYKRRGKKPGTSSGGHHLMASAKIRQAIDILHKEIHEHKFIIFSQFTSMLDLVEPFFAKEGFKFVRYDGSMKNDAREESLRRLRGDANTRMLLCSLKCGSLGLNLTAATRVIILEPFWNPFVEEQAIDRVHRLTQTVDVTVYKLTVEDTVEARILDLQDKKRLLAEHAIEGGMRKKDALKLGLREILELFRHDGRGPEGGEDGQGSDARFDDPKTVSQDVRGMVGFAGRADKARAGDEGVYARRW